MQRRQNGDFDQQLLNFQYTKQIIIDITQDEDLAVALKYKWDRNHKDNPCTLIDGEIIGRFDETAGAVNVLSSIQASPEDVIRIYIIGHGSPGSDIMSGKNTEATHEQLAAYLANFVQDKNVVINLISCAGGRGEEDIPNPNTDVSYAAKLHKDLQKLTGGKDTPVIARTHLMGVYVGRSSKLLGTKATSDLTSTWEEARDKPTYVPKQPGSKIIISSENGKQVKRDVYYHTLKDKVLQALVKAHDSTTVSSKQAFLKYWIPKLEKMSPEEMLQAMSVELQDKNSLLRLHTNFLVGLFKDADTYTQVKSLVDEGNKIMKSEFTFKQTEIIEDTLSEPNEDENSMDSGNKQP